MAYGGQLPGGAADHRPLGLQPIDVENRPMVCDEGPQALCALSASCLGLQRIDVEKSQLVREEGLQALCALSASWVCIPSTLRIAR